MGGGRVSGQLVGGVQQYLERDGTVEVYMQHRGEARRGWVGVAGVRLFLVGPP